MYFISSIDVANRLNSQYHHCRSEMQCCFIKSRDGDDNNTLWMHILRGDWAIPSDQVSECDIMQRQRWWQITIRWRWATTKVTEGKDGSDAKEGATALKMHHITRAEANASELRQEKRIEVEKLKDNILWMRFSSRHIVVVASRSIRFIARIVSVHG